MPILTFLGWTPSGASAKAVLAFRKGKKGAFSGAPRRFPKLSTMPTVAVEMNSRGAARVAGVGVPCLISVPGAPGRPGHATP